MNRVSMDTIIFFDSGNKPFEKTEPERFYYGFVLGLLVELHGSYTVTSNRKSRFGRYDIMLEPYQVSGKALSNYCVKDAIIIEFKVLDSENGEKPLADTVQDALDQINSTQYTSLLEAKGIPSERIIKYGGAFEGKKMLIGA